MGDHILEAEYADGYIHRQDKQDHSPYVSMANIFSDILEQRPVPTHGKQVALRLVGPTNTYSIDWSTLPDNARPIYLRNMSVDTVNGMIETPYCTKYKFGYQYNDKNGKNYKEEQEII